MDVSRPINRHCAKDVQNYFLGLMSRHMSLLCSGGVTHRFLVLIYQPVQGSMCTCR